jgi:hypothetical protein
MARIEDVDFGLRNVAAIGLRFQKLERQIVTFNLGEARRGGMGTISFDE